MSFAARITDTTSDGIITGMGVPTVQIGGLPAAVVGNISTPVSGNIPMPFMKGSLSVFIGGMPALRVGDTAQNGSTIITGATNVLIG